MTLRSCIDCGELCQGARCPDCRPVTDRQYYRAPKISSTARGYDQQWRRLSERARRLQPWCSDCGSPEDLTGEHTAAAWERKAAGLPIRLQDVDVLCRACNGARGAPGGMTLDETAPTLAVEAKFRSLTSAGVPLAELLQRAGHRDAGLRLPLGEQQSAERPEAADDVQLPRDRIAGVSLLSDAEDGVDGEGVAVVVGHADPGGHHGDGVSDGDVLLRGHPRSLA